MTRQHDDSTCHVGGLGQAVPVSTTNRAYCTTVYLFAIVPCFQGLQWLAIANCARHSADASLVCFAMAMYSRYFGEFVWGFKFDDRPFLKQIGRADLVRRMEHVRLGVPAC